MAVDKQNQGRQNREWGAYCEQIAADYFLSNDYTIRERNWKLNKIEIDLIVQKERTIAFVEVKARKPLHQDPVLAVDQKKQKSMIKAADIYLRNEKILMQYRFDILAVTGEMDNFKIDHYADAFMPQVNGGLS